jgi:hypothetical protein
LPAAVVPARLPEVLARLADAALAAALPPELRERVALGKAGLLGEHDVLVLLADLEAMACLLGGST